MKSFQFKKFFVFPLIMLMTIVSANTQPVNIKVYPEIPLQTIKSVGGNYSMTRYTNSAWDAIGGETLKQFRPENVRVALPLRIRRVDYKAYKGDKLTEQPLVITLFESMKRMKNEFGVKSFTVSVWDLPDEVIVDPAKANQRVVKPEAYDEVLDMLIAFLLKAKNDYGVEVDYFSFNESDGGWQVIFSPEATRAFIKKAGKRFSEAGLNTKFLLADTAQTKGTVEFATMIMADSTIWKYIGPLSFHSWWSEKIPDSEFERVAALGKALRKQVWCAELGFDAAAYKVKGMVQSWDYALRFARISHRMMKYAQVEVSMYWTWQNDYPLMSTDLKTIYPSYYVTRQLVNYLNKGTQIVHSRCSDPEVLAISGIHSDGSKVLQIINMKKVPVTVKIQGFDSKSVDMVSTTEANNWEEQKKVTSSKKGSIQIKLKAESVNTLIL
jgi:hypothetical protein